jgi:hypothetical protein
VGDRAASHLGSQHIELAAWRVWVEAVLDQPAGHLQASQRPPRADHAEVDVGAVAGDDVAKVLLVPERQDGEVVQGIALARPGPVDHAGDLVTVDEHVGDLQVAVREHRCPRPERSLGNPAVARDQAGGKDVVRDELLAFAVELRRDLLKAPAGPWRQRRVVQHRIAVTYQPASRYWPFQWAETGIYLVLSLALAGYCFRRLSRLS